MKIIVISGASSGVGKTTLAVEIKQILPHSKVIKIGHGTKKEDINNSFYPAGTPFSVIAREHGRAKLLIIESNSVLKEINPDLSFYLEGSNAKPSAAHARKKADIKSGEHVDVYRIQTLAGKINVSIKDMRRILWLAGAKPERTSAIILAGGKSTRMGTDKAMLKIKGQTTVERLRDKLSPLFDEVIVSTAGTNIVNISSVKLVADIFPDKGPISGIYSCLKESSSNVNFVVGCDIPDINIALINKLLSFSGNYDIAVPSLQTERTEPLYAVYSKNIVPEIEKLIEKNRLRVAELFNICKTKIVKTSEKKWYNNLNTMRDYKTYINRKLQKETL